MNQNKVQIQGMERTNENSAKKESQIVLSLAKRYADYGLSQEELIKAGNKGLELAARKYDEQVGIRFEVYAIWWVRQSIVQEIEQSTAICLRKSPASHANKCDAQPTCSFSDLSEREQGILKMYYGIDEESKSLEDIGKAYGLTNERVKQLMEKAIRKLKR